MDPHTRRSLELRTHRKMKLLTTFLITVLTSGLALADPPQTFRPDRYKDLYLRSAFTDPPEKIVEEEIPSDLPDWVLTGITKYVDKVEVNVMNMKDRTRVTIPSAEATELGFSIVDVQQDRNYFEHSVATLKKGDATGEVRFDKKFLVLKKVAGPTPAKTNRSTGAQARSSGGTNGRQTPPTPPGARSTGAKSTTGSTPPKPGSVPQPGGTASSTSSNTKSGTSSSTKSKRTRYVPRPKK